MIAHELTGNHYISVPIIEGDAGIPMITALHGALAGVVAWGGNPLLRPHLDVAGQAIPLADLPWERMDRWIPRARTRLPHGLELVVTVCAPGGYDPLLRGGFLDLQVHNHGSAEQSVTAGLDVQWSTAELHVRGSRALPGVSHLATLAARPGLALEAGTIPFGAALAISGEPEMVVQAAAGLDAVQPLAGDSELSAGTEGMLRARLAAQVLIPARRSQRFTFYLGVGRDRDSALATAAQLRRIGADRLLRRARLVLSQLVRRGEDAETSDLLNRNLLFNHFFALGRGLDDDRLYALASRSPLHGVTAVSNERETLLWTLPALTLNDPLLARELLLRTFEVFSGAAGQPARYLDGGILAPGYVLDHLLAYPLALDRYVREAEDPSVLDDPLVQDVLREIDGTFYNRLHPEVLLCDTELLSADDPADFPYPALGNGMLWAYCKALPRIWRGEEGEPPASFADAAEEVAAAVWQRCTVAVDGSTVLASSTNLHGQAAVYDDPVASLALLPSFGFCSDDDPIWRNTMELLRSSAYPLWHGEASFPGLAARHSPREAATAALAAELLTPVTRARALKTLRELRLRDGVASDRFDPQTGETTIGAHAAALAGFVAWALDRGAPAPRKHAKKR